MDTDGHSENGRCAMTEEQAVVVAAELGVDLRSVMRRLLGWSVRGGGRKTGFLARGGL